MFCQNCGNQLPDGAKFCTRCGAPVASAQPPAPQPAPVPPQPAPPVPAPQPVALSADPEADTIFSLAPGALTTLPSQRGRRSTIVLAPPAGARQALPVIEQALAARGFKQVDYNGEPIWKKGTGLATAMQYVRLRTRGDLVALSAWVAAGLGSANFKEMPLTGMAAAIPKKSLQKTLDEVRAAIGC